MPYKRFSPVAWTFSIPKFVLIFALGSPSYAVAFDTTADHSQGDEPILTSHFAPTPSWLIVDGFALLVGDVPESPGFEVNTLKGAVTSFRCAPELITAAAPLDADFGSPR